MPRSETGEISAMLVEVRVESDGYRSGSDLLHRGDKGTSAHTQTTEQTSSVEQIKITSMIDQLQSSS